MIARPCPSTEVACSSWMRSTFRRHFGCVGSKESRELKVFLSGRGLGGPRSWFYESPKGKSWRWRPERNDRKSRSKTTSSPDEVVTIQRYLECSYLAHNRLSNYSPNPISSP